VNLPGANAVSAVDDEPHAGQSLLKAERRDFEYGSGLQREGRAWVFRVALPYAGLLKPNQLFSFAARALHGPVIPPRRDHEFLTVLERTEVDDRLLQCLNVLHVSKSRSSAWCVKYIPALPSPSKSAPSTHSCTAE